MFSRTHSSINYQKGIETMSEKTLSETSRVLQSKVAVDLLSSEAGEVDLLGS